MTEQNTSNPNPNTQTQPPKVNLADIDAIAAEYRKASTDEELGKIEDKNRSTIHAFNIRARRLGRVDMPLYFRITNRAEENVVYDKVRMARDAVLTVVAGIFTWKGLKWVYEWVRPAV